MAFWKKQSSPRNVASGTKPTPTEYSGEQFVKRLQELPIMKEQMEVIRKVEREERSHVLEAIQQLESEISRGVADQVLEIKSKEDKWRAAAAAAESARREFERANMQMLWFETTKEQEMRRLEAKLDDLGNRVVREAIAQCQRDVVQLNAARSWRTDALALGGYASTETTSARVLCALAIGQKALAELPKLLRAALASDEITTEVERILSSDVAAAVDSVNRDAREEAKSDARRLARWRIDRMGRAMQSV